MLFFFFAKPYISITGEIMESIHTENKEQVKKNLAMALDEINQEYEDDISVKFMMTVGDEFQGLICRGANIMKMILELKNKMHPARLRFGIGIGEITTNIPSETSIIINGPGYDKAREALEHLRNAAGKNQSHIADVYVEATGENQARTELVNTVFSLLTTLEYDWSDRQREIVYDMISHKDKQSNVAKRLGITQSTVQKSLTSAHYYTYENASKTLDVVFSEIKE